MVGGHRTATHAVEPGLAPSRAVPSTFPPSGSLQHVPRLQFHTTHRGRTNRFFARRLRVCRMHNPAATGIIWSDYWQRSDGVPESGCQPCDPTPNHMQCDSRGGHAITPESPRDKMLKSRSSHSRMLVDPFQSQLSTVVQSRTSNAGRNPSRTPWPTTPPKPGNPPLARAGPRRQPPHAAPQARSPL